MAGSETIYLVGFMCSGKSSVGRELATLLGLRFLDLDEEVERRTGQSIASLWRERGEAAFRAVESQALSDVAGLEMVVATGGGTPLSDDNRRLMLESGICLWLQVPVTILLQRMQETSLSSRPLWQDEESFRDLFHRRESTYRFAHHAVDLGALPPDSAARALGTILRMESAKA